MNLLQRLPHRPITADEYNRMAECGILQPDERVELIEGVIVPLAAQNKPHADAVAYATNVLVRRYGETHIVRVQLPLNLTGYSEPEPDFALIKRELHGTFPRHPTSADLIVEVADTSYDYDRWEKLSLYARCGIPEYWILNVRDEWLERYREPKIDPRAPFGFSYSVREIDSETDLLPESKT